MATDTWNGGSDNFTTAADWSTGAPPTSTDTADLESGNPQITSNVGTIGSVFLNSASLSVEGGSVNVAQSFYNLAGTLGIDDKFSTYVGNTYVPPAGGSTVSVAGTLTNTGTVTVGNIGLSSATTVSVAALSNSGSLNITGSYPNGSSSVQATLAVAGAAGLGTAGTITGTVTLDYNADLQFGSGGITTIAPHATLNLTGSQATVGLAGSTVHNAALAGLSENDGTLNLVSDAISTSASTFTNNNTLQLYDEGLGTPSFALAGMLTNVGAISFYGGTISAQALNDSGSIYFNSSSNSPNVVAVNGGVSSISGTVAGTGNLDFEGGSAIVGSGAYLSSSNVTLGGNAYVEIAASASNVTSPFSFANNATATLQLDASVLPASGGTLSNLIIRFASGDSIDLRGLGFAIGATATYDSSNNTLAVTSNGVTDTLTLAIPQSTTFLASSDGNGGTVVTAAAPLCFAGGTMLRVFNDGVEQEIAVEHLAVGDIAVTASGQNRSVRWIGHRVLDGHGRALPHGQQPIRIRQGAFGMGLPWRDLTLSPGHPVLVGADADGEGGHLVPAMCLVNGTTVERVAVESVTYWHVELDSHDILLAEGLPAESYLDSGDRAFFTEAPLHTLANPDFVVPGLGLRCRPVAVDGPVVEAERRRLDAVFAATLAAQSAWNGSEVLLSM